MSDLSWLLLLVNSGMEEIEVRREGKVFFHGTVPAGFAMHLTVGDSVLYRAKATDKKMTKKWDLRIYRGLPYMRFGKNFGKSNHHVRL